MDKFSLPIFRTSKEGNFSTATLVFPLLEGDGEIVMCVKISRAKGASEADAEQVAKVTVIAAAQAFIEESQELVPEKAKDAICTLSYAAQLLVEASEGKAMAAKEVTDIEAATNGAVVDPMLKAALGFLR